MISKILKYLNNLNVRQVLLLAGISAGIMFASIYIFLNEYTTKEMDKIEERVGEEKQQLTKVVVAKTDISPRIRIRENMIEEKEIPTSDVQSDAVTNKAEIIDKTAKITILTGDVITNRKLYKNTDQQGLVGTIPPDCRAISIPVNDVTAVAGFAKPGDYVDLLLVENDGTSATTNIILQNVLLLSINQSMDRNEITKEGESNANVAIANPSIVTVALRPNEALKLVSATKLGDIYLMLRPSKPLENYVEGLEYKIISANAPPSQKYDPPPENTLPEQKEQKESETAISQPVIEIIQGDQLLTVPEDQRK